MRGRVCTPLVWDLSIFMLGWNSSWRHFALYATTCIPSCLCFCWHGTATDAQEKQVYVPLLGFFLPPRCLLQAPNTYDWLSLESQRNWAVFPWRASWSDVTITALTFLTVSLCKCSNSVSDWRIHDVSSTSYICLESAGDYLPRWRHLFTKAHS